ncbi:putative Voltage-dependent anion-selective channel [Heracleum sosnowskyi]|uniref:Voltage-dependent anion-selective channel n=1 Tax=Heracleum sosnowskyi TaxID=360622 RepID=A0AAD8M953_9APIA|nr:putative Voltage-dependent anion-selective channel [Heracleum sosnowskyi]
MEKNPGFYSYFSRKARDLLYKDHNDNLDLNPYVFTGYAFTSAFRNGEFVSSFSKKLEFKNITHANIRLKLGEDSNILTTFTVDQLDLVPGLKAIFSFNVLKPHTIGIRYLNRYAGINVNIVGLCGSPIFNFSGSRLLRIKNTSLRSNILLDTKRGIAKCSAAITYFYGDMTASFILNSHKGNALKASYYHNLDSKLWKNMNIIQRALASLSMTAIAAKASHKFSTDEIIITIGTQFALTGATTLKARVNSVGNASAVMKSKWNQKSLIVISGEVNMEAANPTPKFGIAFSTKS